jgi:dehydrogenase/reductase SDR family protein 7B
MQFLFRTQLDNQRMAIENKVAIVTGSSRGIGLAIAAELAFRGAKVVINARNEQQLQQAQNDLLRMGLLSKTVVADISVPDECERLIEATIATYGRLDLLVNNAGVSMEGDFAKLSPVVFQRVFAVNTLGASFVTQAAVPYLKKTRGSVTFISSLAALHGMPQFSVYCASKMALTAFAQALSIEFQELGIHVGIAYLGFTENDPRKTIIGTEGQAIPQPTRKCVRPKPVSTVAKQVVKMIERRRAQQVFTPLGYVASFIARFSPQLARHCVKRIGERSTSSSQVQGTILETIKAQDRK